MLRWGIPEYRLPKKVLDHEIELIRRKGVKFVYNCRVGKDITIQKLRQDNEAVFIAAGAKKAANLASRASKSTAFFTALNSLETQLPPKNPQ